MKLKWDEEQIRTYMSNIQQKGQIDRFDRMTLSTYTHYLSASNKEKLATPSEKIKNQPDEKKLIHDIKEVCNDFNYYTGKLPVKIYRQIMNLLDCLGFLYFNPKQQYEYPITNKKINIDDLIKQSYDIFGDISPCFIRQLDYIYEHNLVEFNQKKSKFISPCFCLPDLHNKVAPVYINAKEANEFSTEGTLNHELTHSITCMVNPNMFIKDKLYILTEAHPIYILLHTNNVNYQKTNELNYMKANNNYLSSLREIVCDFRIMLCLSDLNSITSKNIKRALLNKLGLESTNFDMFLDKYSSYDIGEALMYLISGIWALHLSEQDEDKIKILFTDTLFQDTQNLYQFFKKIDFNFKDEYYACDLFNRNNCEVESTIKHHTRKRQ